MKHNDYDAIFCDLGNVLVNFDHRIAVKKILTHTPKREEDIYSLFFDSPLTGLYEEGKLSSKEFFSRVKDSLKLKMDSSQFFPIWNDIFFDVPVNIKMHEFLKNMRPGYKLVMVSNLNQTHFEYLKKKMPIFNIFHKLVLSYEVGFRKPAAQIYQYALESVQTIPSKAFYIDDRPDLIKASSNMGINGIIFDGEPAFKKIIQEFTP